MGKQQRALRGVDKMANQRCTGCKWRTPHRLGGQGTICLQKDGKCPEWAIKWALRYGKAGLRPAKVFRSDEQLLERMRL